MPALRANVDYCKQIFRERLGNPYVYGGVYSKTNKRQGCDCSALVAHMLNAVLFGANMQWNRVDPTQGNAWITTESWRPIEVGQRGPFGTITVASANDFPADAVVKICLHHGPGGGVASHMNCAVDGVLMESNGDNGTCTTGTGAMPLNSSYWNDWAYLPGPITGSGVTPPPALSTEQLVREIHRETVTQHGPSRSFMAVDGNPIDTPLGVEWNIDGNIHTLVLTEAYRLNVPMAVEIVEHIAEHGVYEKAWAAKQPWLATFAKQYCQGLVNEKKTAPRKAAPKRKTP